MWGQTRQRRSSSPATSEVGSTTWRALLTEVRNNAATQALYFIKENEEEVRLTHECRREFFELKKANLKK